MNRGTVMALEKRSAVLLMPDGRFVRVKREPQHEIGEEAFARGDGARSTARTRRRMLQAGASAMAIMLVAFGFFLFRTPPVVAYVSMDINPSIEIGLDAKKNVRELRAVNEDALLVVEGIRFKGRKLEDVMNEVAGQLAEGHYLSVEDGDIVIVNVPVRSPGREWEEIVTDTVSRILNEAASDGAADSLRVTTFTVPKEIRDDANANGISSGKMAFWLISKQEGHDVTLDAIKASSLEDIASDWGGVKQVIGDYENKRLVVDDRGGLRPKGDDDGKKSDGDKKNGTAGTSNNGEDLQGDNVKKPDEGKKTEGDISDDGKKNGDKKNDGNKNDDQKNDDQKNDDQKNDDKKNEDEKNDDKKNDDKKNDGQPATASAKPTDNDNDRNSGGDRLGSDRDNDKNDKGQNDGKRGNGRDGGRDGRDDRD
ncbi:anti-sigma factor domain-containing protein [Cohnella suwonensis]|uniref:Anti-sigma factor domain-containing protein n=1 Tax=Cohnella suwonensis TaxID=696072 RepID=A0ABW0M1D1_9BACL